MIIFDLDRTIWDCFDKNGNQIWAKQMIPPFHTENQFVIDDVNSKCSLKPGVVNYIKWLKKKNCIIYFCSVGAYYKMPRKFQPSIILLETFGILKFFDIKSVLKYKDFDKNLFLKNINERSIFFDDNDKIIKKASVFKKLKVIDAKKIDNWNNLIKAEIC